MYLTCGSLQVWSLHHTLSNFLHSQALLPTKQDIAREQPRHVYDTDESLQFQSAKFKLSADIQYQKKVKDIQRFSWPSSPQ